MKKKKKWLGFSCGVQRRKKSRKPRACDKSRSCLGPCFSGQCAVWIKTEQKAQISHTLVVDFQWTVLTRHPKHMLCTQTYCSFCTAFWFVHKNPEMSNGTSPPFQHPPEQFHTPQSPLPLTLLSSQFCLGLSVVELGPLGAWYLCRSASSTYLCVLKVFLSFHGSTVHLLLWWDRLDCLFISVGLSNHLLKDILLASEF